MLTFLNKFFIWWNQETLGTKLKTIFSGKYVGKDENGNKYYTVIFYLVTILKALHYNHYQWLTPISWCRKVHFEIIFGTQRLTQLSKDHVAAQLWPLKPKPSLKIRTASAIFWIYLGIFRDYGLENILLGINFFVS